MYIIIINLVTLCQGLIMPVFNLNIWLMKMYITVLYISYIINIPENHLKI